VLKKSKEFGLKKSNYKMKNKRGSIQDIFFFTVFIATFIIFIMIVGYVLPKVANELKETDINNSEGAATALGFYDTLPTRLDYIFLAIFLGVILGVFVSSFLIYTHPIFIPIYIILLGICVMVGEIMRNIHEEFTTNVDLVATSTTQVFANQIMENYVLTIVAIGVITMILLFGRMATTGEQRI